MNNDEILQIVGPGNFPVAVGGHDSDESDLDCQIFNILVFDGGDANDQIIPNNSTTVKISHENFSETRSEHLLTLSNLEIIRDDEWQLKIFLSQIQEKKESLFSTSVKNALIDSQFALSKAKTAIEQDDPFVSCWIKCSALSLIDSILLQNQIIPKPTTSLSSMRNLKEKNTQFADKIISETGIERATKSLLTRMLKSSIGFSDMVEQNNNSIIIEKRANYLIQNSLLSDCYLFLNYQNRKNFNKIKNSLNKNSDKIHVLNTAFDLSHNTSDLAKSIETLDEITNSLLNYTHDL